MAADVFATFLRDERSQIDARLALHRAGIRASLDGLTQEEARRRLVPSATTLLGILTHVTYVEQIWPQEGVLGIPRADLGLPPSPADAFQVPASVTISGALAAHAAAVEQADQVFALRGLDDVVTGHRFGPVTVRWVMLHLISELAQHHGHADILREQVLASRR